MTLSYESKVISEHLGKVYQMCNDNKNKHSKKLSMYSQFEMQTGNSIVNAAVKDLSYVVKSCQFCNGLVISSAS